MKRIQKILAILCAAAMLLGCLPAAAEEPATPTDLDIQEQSAEAAAVAETEEPSGEAEAKEAAADVETEEPSEEAETKETAAVEAETAEAPDPAQELLDAGYILVTVIREEGTNLYHETDDHAEVIGSLRHGEEIWAKPVGGIWASVWQGDENAEPVYFNLNNVALRMGEVGYDIPIRKVTLTSTLEGLTEIEEGTEVTMTAEFSGFPEDEIVDIAWQYRPADDPEGEFRDIEGARGFTYTYQINAENVHHEWRIVLTLRH